MSDDSAKPPTMVAYVARAICCPPKGRCRAFQWSKETGLPDRCSAYDEDRLKQARAWHSEPVREALSDLAGCKALERLMYPRDEKVMKIIHEAAALHEARKKAPL